MAMKIRTGRLLARRGGLVRCLPVPAQLRRPVAGISKLMAVPAPSKLAFATQRIANTAPCHIAELLYHYPPYK